jgi:hypothetical protein
LGEVQFGKVSGARSSDEFERAEKAASALRVNISALAPVRAVLPEKLQHAVKKLRDGAGVLHMVALAHGAASPVGSPSITAAPREFMIPCALMA